MQKDSYGLYFILFLSVVILKNPILSYVVLLPLFIDYLLDSIFSAFDVFLRGLGSTFEIMCVT